MMGQGPRRREPSPGPALPLGPGLAIGLFGLLMGLVIGMFIWGHQIEQLNLSHRRLSEELAALREDNERLRAEPRGASRPVRELSIRFLDVRDERLRLELNRQLRALLADAVVGVPVTDLDPLLVSRIVEERLFALEDTLWRVEVAGAYLIWETFILYVRVHPQGEVHNHPHTP